MEMEATGAPQKHHHTLNQQVGSITDCQLIIVDEGVKPAVERVYTIKNTIDYY